MITDTLNSPENMRKYFIKLEKNNYVPSGTPGHGFNGYLDISLNDDEMLRNQSEAQTVLKATAKEFGQDPNKIFDLIEADLITQV
jgi:choline dehydrogenase